MEPLKIGVIGAGSLAWSAQLIRDLTVTRGLWGSTVVLMDTNAERLDLVHAFATRYAAEVHADVTFVKTLQRRVAIEDAAFVINTAMAGGHAYYERMRAVSEAGGYYRGINSVPWNMISDYHTIWGYYQLELMTAVARDVEAYSPDAWLLLLANPVCEGTTLLARTSRVKVLGLCHGHLGYQRLSTALGLAPQDVDATAVGVNHLIWLTTFHHHGADAYPLLDAWIAEASARYWRRWQRTQTDPFDLQLSPAAIDLYQTYGAFPIGDTVRGGTWKYHWSPRTKRRWFGLTGGPDSAAGWRIYLSNHEQWLTRSSRAIRDPQTPLTTLLPPQPGQESVVPIMSALIHDERGVYQVNLPNQGALPGVPDDVAVEVPVEIDGRGLHRRPVDPLPPRVMKYAMAPRLMRMEWALDAFLEGGRSRLFEWLIEDPRTRSTRQVEGVLDALLALPDNAAMAQHFR